MSLRIRLIVTIGCLLLLSLFGGGFLARQHAMRSVEAEMVAALAVGRQSVVNAGDDLPAAGDVRAALSRLVASFDGDRHVRATLLDTAGHVVAFSTPAQSDRAVPSWFEAALASEERSADLPIRGASALTVRLTTDSANEVGEVWREFRDGSAILAVFCGLSFAFIYWGLGRTLAPLNTLSAGFAAIGDGAYDTRVAIPGPPELANLAHAFNQMAERLSALEATNQRLNTQLSTLREEERADLARDLHDEVGPFLFAVTVDAATITRFADGPEIRERVRSIQDSVGHAQRHVKAILRRLKPAALAEIGLAQAVRNLVAFWHHRHPEIQISLDISAELGPLADPEESAIYRLIQESLTNAVRHGHPSVIDIAVTATEEGIMVVVSDDGVGLASTERSGFGLAGMRERVTGLGGTLTVANRAAGSGTVVIARLRNTRLAA